jgi:hypothetical protein
MNLEGTHDIACGDTCLRRNWGKRNKQARSPAGEAASTLGTQAWPRPTEIRDARWPRPLARMKPAAPP